MTLLEAINGKSAKELAALDDKALNEHFGPMLNVTRPELAPKPIKSSRVSTSKSSVEESLKDAKKRLAEKMAERMGIDLKFDE